MALPAVLRLVGYASTGLGLVPLAFVAALWSAGRRLPALWWWVAAAYGVSFVADVLALSGVDPWWVSASYPVSQAGILGLVFLPRQRAYQFLGVLVLASLVPGTLALRSVAWGTVAVLALRRPKPLQRALLVSFGAGLGLWWCYALSPSLATWLAYQATRWLGTGLLCWAAGGDHGHTST